jgi:hypothetical protein
MGVGRVYVLIGVLCPTKLLKTGGVHNANTSSLLDEFEVYEN